MHGFADFDMFHYLTQLAEDLFGLCFVLIDVRISPHAKRYVIIGFNFLCFGMLNFCFGKQKMAGRGCHNGIELYDYVFFVAFWSF